MAKENVLLPDDYFWLQRSWPNGAIKNDSRQQALNQRAQYPSQPGLTWSFAGPNNLGGRVTCAAMDPRGTNVIYVGSASGGLFKSIDGGASWTALLDDLDCLAVGALTLDPNNPDILYVGMGEPNGGGGSVAYGGTGVYKSIDGGAHFVSLGLQDTFSIGRIVVDPSDSNTLYVAAMGRLFDMNPERGVYRSLDAGITWQKVLFISEQTGCIDLSINPNNPDIIFAAMWQRVRTISERTYGGEECGLYRSTNGGDSWQELTGGLPGGANVGRIGVAVAPSMPNIVYAIYADVVGNFTGVYRSADHGMSWNRTNDGALSSLYGSYGWWFGNIRVDPVDSDTVYALGLYVYGSENGGASWSWRNGGMHVDQHDFWIHPSQSDLLLAANDGGLYLSANGGINYQQLQNLPITQFYTSALDPQFPERIYGGAQDNGTWRTLTGGLDDWIKIYSGDGFYVLVDPIDNNFVYAESQYGGLVRSTNGGFSFSSATFGVNSSDRFNWSSPLVIDPQNPETLYFGSHRIYRSTNRASSWSVLSPDLTSGDGGVNVVFGTISTLEVSPLDSQRIYAGTDDGHVWTTADGGGTWNEITGDLPQRWITRVTASPHQSETVYVTVSGFRWDNYLPHVFRSLNAGGTWEDISTNLPEAPLNDVLEDPSRVGVLYVAGDMGVFTTDQPGSNWQLIGGGLPHAPAMDLTLHDPSRTLLVATFGRGMWTIPLEPPCYTPDDYSQALASWPLASNIPDLINILNSPCP
ncbi:MAG: glycosyl hydrolase [Acidobacteria bacterium]|nr:glycosyl hydrolase [Acidobacteriota bacterium]